MKFLSLILQMSAKLMGPGNINVKKAFEIILRRNKPQKSILCIVYL